MEEYTPFNRLIHVDQTGCWLWQGAVIAGEKPHFSGYAMVMWEAKPQLAIRWFLERSPNHKAAKHRELKPLCENYKRCVNPAHWAARGGELGALQLGMWQAICEVTGARFQIDRRWRTEEQIAAFLAYEFIKPQVSYPQIGALTNRDHSSVIYAVSQIRKRGRGLWGKYERQLLGGGLDGTAQPESIAA